MDCNATLSTPFHRGHKWLPVPADPDTWATTGPTFR